MSTQWDIIPDENTIKLQQKSRLVMILEGRIEVLGGKWSDFFCLRKEMTGFTKSYERGESRRSSLMVRKY